MTETDRRLIRKFLEEHPDRAIATVENLETGELTEFLRLLPIEEAAQVFKRLAPFKAVSVLSSIEVSFAAELLENTPLLIADTFLRKVEKSLRKKIIQEIPKEAALKLRRSLEYSLDSLGAHLDQTSLTLSKDLTAKEALSRIRKYSRRAQNEIFVLNRNHKLLGYTDIKTVLSSQSDTTIEDIMMTCPSYLPEMSVEDIVKNWDYNFNQVPIVSLEGMFLGTVSLKKLIGTELRQESISSSAIKAGNAIGDLYLIGLSSLFSNSTDSTHLKNN